MRGSLAFLALSVLAAPAAAQGHGRGQGPGPGPGGYAGEQSREIKALSAQEQSDLLAGRGLGFARAGELNHHPGPAHVLELRDRLGLTPGQLGGVEASFRRMEAAARPLGAELVQRERELDAAFRHGTMTPLRLDSEAGAIAVIQGRLRAVHLRAHLEMRDLLTPVQIGTYDALRGYSGSDAPAPAHGHHGAQPR